MIRFDSNPYQVIKHAGLYNDWDTTLEQSPLKIFRIGKVIQKKWIRLWFQFELYKIKKVHSTVGLHGELVIYLTILLNSHLLHRCKFIRFQLIIIQTAAQGGRIDGDSMRSLLFRTVYQGSHQTAMHVV